MWNRAMAGFTIGTNTEANGALLRRLNWIVTLTIDLKPASSAFIESIFCLNQFRTILYNPTRALVSSDFLISSGHKYDVSLQAHAAAFE